MTVRPKKEPPASEVSVTLAGLDGAAEIELPATQLEPPPPTGTLAGLDVLEVLIGSEEDAPVPGVSTETGRPTVEEGVAQSPSLPPQTALEIIFGAGMVDPDVLP